MMTSLGILRLSERVSQESVQQLADSLHGALQRNASGEVSTTDPIAREIIVTVFGMGNSADDVIMAYLKYKRLLNDVTVAYCDGLEKRERQQYPKSLAAEVAVSLRRSSTDYRNFNGPLRLRRPPQAPMISPGCSKRSGSPSTRIM